MFLFLYIFRMDMIAPTAKEQIIQEIISPVPRTLPTTASNFISPAPKTPTLKSGNSPIIGILEAISAL